MTAPSFIDGYGEPLHVGSRVRVGDGPGNRGIVVSISDADGDVGDEGQPIFYPPRVYVRFDGGVEDDFGTSSTATWYDESDAPYQCDDVEAVPA